MSCFLFQPRYLAATAQDSPAVTLGRQSGQGKSWNREVLRDYFPVFVSSECFCPAQLPLENESTPRLNPSSNKSPI